MSKRSGLLEKLHAADNDDTYLSITRDEVSFVLSMLGERTKHPILRSPPVDGIDGTPSPCDVCGRKYCDHLWERP